MPEKSEDHLSRTDFRIALIGIVVEEFASTDKINEVICQYRDYVIGRMGIPRARGNIAVISVVLDAPGEVISSVSGKLGMLPGVSCKTVYSKIAPNEEK